MVKLPNRAESQDSTETVPTVAPQFGCGARTDKGRVRENNEDSFAIEPELNLFVLSDGMGGQASGEIASRIATETVVEYCRAAERDSLSLPQQDRLSGLSDKSSRLAAGIRRANSAIRNAALNQPECHGMGATVVAVRFDGCRMSLAHVGDSRAYRFRSGQLEQLTRDHSFVAEQLRQGLLTQWEAEQSQMQNVLLRALGQEPDVEIDVTEELVLDDDAILLCSDGLTRELSDEQIAVTLENAEDAQSAADCLVSAANDAGGGDNITAVVVRPAGKRRGTFPRIGRWLRRSKES
ncbi:MAG: Stp1/IreP family PP2C-type Ser/Thr phosphatase [Candidatus Acidiferrales bacterium]